MRPILFSLFGIPFASWYVFFALAGVSAFLCAQALLRVAARTPEDQRVRGAEAAALQFSGLFAVCYVAGWFGARAFSVWNEQFELEGLSAKAAAVFSLGPMTFYGGAIAATLTGVFYARAALLPVGLLFDACMPAGTLALGLGRIGCHLNGDDFGLPVPGIDPSFPPWWAVQFPNAASATGSAVFRYPVQLEEAAFSILLAAAAAWLFCKLSSSHSAPARAWRQRLGPGALGAVTALASALHRFANEAYRGDPRGAFFGTPLSISQGIAVLVFLVSAGFIALRMRAAFKRARLTHA